MKSAILLRPRAAERGSSLVFFALFIVFLLGAAALAIDLGILYVARSEAQRSADAAALAGANVFTGACHLTNSCDSTATQSYAAQSAVAAAKANDVAGQPGSVNCDLTSGYATTSCGGIQFSDPSGTGTEPQITVTVQRAGIPLIFAKLFGADVGNVSAVATAEAYQGGGSAMLAEQCVTPFLVPDCDPNPYDETTTNDGCSIDSATGKYYGQFIDSSGTILNPQQYSTSSTGILGEPWTLHYTYPGTAGPAGSVTPSQWSMVSFSNNNGTNDLVAYIESCPVNTTIACGSTLQLNPGNDPVSIDGAVNSLIQHTSCGGNGKCGTDGLSPIQDSLQSMSNTTNGYPTDLGGGNCPPDEFPFTVGTWSTTGSGGSNCASVGASNSVVLAPVYAGDTLTPGCSPTTSCTVTVNGYVVLFLDYSTFSSGTETVQANVINALSCGSTSGNGNGGQVIAAGGSPIPIRLIQHAN